MTATSSLYQFYFVWWLQNIQRERSSHLNTLQVVLRVVLSISFFFLNLSSHQPIQFVLLFVILFGSHSSFGWWRSLQWQAKQKYNTREKYNKFSVSSKLCLFFAKSVTSQATLSIAHLTRFFSFYFLPKTKTIQFIWSLYTLNYYQVLPVTGYLCQTPFSTKLKPMSSFLLSFQFFFTQFILSMIRTYKHTVSLFILFTLLFHKQLFFTSKILSNFIFTLKQNLHFVHTVNKSKLVYWSS